ncbi:MAG: 4Fe-4S binding protein [Deltaproteobacteria bacterium]|nr:4Fe-4S binding protein [Deltaproteobacteria bacterium]
METDGVRTVECEQIAPKVNATLCSGCGRCVAACPEKLFAMVTVRFHKTVVIMHPGSCNACGRCVEACPVAALLW